MYSIVHHSKSLYRTLLAVDIIFSLLTFLINTSRYTSNTTSTSLLCEASLTLSYHMEHSSKGDLHYVLGLLELFPKCHPSTRGSTRSLLRTLCTAFTLAFFAGSKDASDWMINCSLESHSLAALFCPWRARQSSLTSVWTSLASCKSLSLVNLVRPLD